MKPITFILLCAAIFCGCSKTNAPAAEAAPAAPSNISVDARTQQRVGIEIRPAEAAPLGAAITATGQLTLNEDRTWRVGAVTEGRVAAVPVHLGDMVKAGQVVAQMHSHEVHDSRASLRQSIAERDRLKVLAEQAKRVRDRTQRLFDLKAASREQLEGAETQLRSAELSVTNADAEVGKNQTHLTEFLEVPAEDKKDGPDEQDYIPIKSPAAGTVMERLANAGTVVSAATPVVTISDLSSLWMIAAVNEADLSHIRRGQPAKISVRAYPDRTFAGSVFQLGERLDPQTRTLQIRVLVANAGGLLKPDMFATVEFAGPASSQTIHVPESAIQELEGKTVVFVQEPDKKFKWREVRTGSRIAGQIEVLSGIEPGTPVVVNGAVLLKSELLKGQEN